MRAVLLTRGDPDARTGGSLYHRRIADAARALGCDIEIRPLERATLAPDGAPDADVVVVDSIVAAVIRPFAFRAPVVASVHQRPGGLVGSIVERAARAARDVRTYLVADAVVVPSPYLGAVLVRAGVPAARMHVVEPGCDPAAPRAREARDGEIRFAYVANLSAHKRPLELLDAFATLSDLDVALTMVGAPVDPRLASAVEVRLRRPDLRGRVTRLGSLAPDEVRRVLYGADVFVLPAVHESYGMAVVEALRCGLPSIVAASGNLPNLVRDGVDGFVVRPRDVGSVAAAMRRLATDESLRARMAAAARASAERFPTWDDAAMRFVSALGAVQGAGTSAA